MTTDDFEIPENLPAEYEGCDIYGTFGELETLFTDDPPKDFRNEALERMRQAFRLPGTLFEAPPVMDDPFTEPNPQALLEAMAQRQAAKILGGNEPRHGGNSLSPFDIVWVVRDCGVGFDLIPGQWREIGRLHEEDTPARVSIVLRWHRSADGEGQAPKLRVEQHARLRLSDISAPDGSPVVVFPTSGMVTGWTIDSPSQDTHAFPPEQAPGTFVFPVSFPEIAALRLLPEIERKLPDNFHPTGARDILQTEMRALPPAPRQRVALAAQWLAKTIKATMTYDDEDLTKEAMRQAAAVLSRFSGS